MSPTWGMSERKRSRGLVLGGQHAVPHRQRRRDTRADLQVLVADRDRAPEGQHVGVHECDARQGPQRQAADPEPLLAAGDVPRPARTPRAPAPARGTGSRRARPSPGRAAPARAARRTRASPSRARGSPRRGPRARPSRAGPSRRRRARAAIDSSGASTAGRASPAGACPAIRSTTKSPSTHDLAGRDGLGDEHADRRPEVQGRGAHRAHLGLLGARAGGERERCQGGEAPWSRAAGPGLIAAFVEEQHQDHGHDGQGLHQDQEQWTRSAWASPTAPRPTPSDIR